MPDELVGMTLYAANHKAIAPGTVVTLHAVIDQPTTFYLLVEDPAGKTTPRDGGWAASLSGWTSETAENLRWTNPDSTGGRAMLLFSREVASGASIDLPATTTSETVFALAADHPPNLPCNVAVWTAPIDGMYSFDATWLDRASGSACGSSYGTWGHIMAQVDGELTELFEGSTRGASGGTPNPDPITFTDTDVVLEQGDELRFFTCPSPDAVYDGTLGQHYCDSTQWDASIQLVF